MGGASTRCQKHGYCKEESLPRRRSSQQGQRQGPERESSKVDDVMDTLQGPKYFSAIDLEWQVEIEEGDKKKPACTTCHGLYEFNVIPFGLCSAPLMFLLLMDNVLKSMKWKICYLYYVIIYSDDFKTHIERLEAVFKYFGESNFKLNEKIQTCL
ncbi:K02A2.6-like [Cordylochernes scorpioides]|uniref:K02A2.6-like n=1 Tax=Cordylochernes scorpioides TaxID=51811 RepID=A0ABY6KXP6_9ARAC|nr:K02A2.6-like [Cordylochernes scorpioides]